jgi:hypothetical protein
MYLMKNVISILIFLLSVSIFGQDSTTTYKKRVLESTEVDFLTSYYNQEGDNAAVSGGIGDEHLTDFTPTIVVSIPVNADDVLTVDVGISAYSSASSSNLNPWDLSSASSNGGDDDEGDDDDRAPQASNIIGSPWVTSSGASKSDLWANATVSYAHSSDDRNTIVAGHAGFSTEFDYSSIGLGGSFTKLFNEKNTEISVKGQAYLDTWKPRYPTELDSYLEVGGSLNSGFFNGVDILNQNGNVIDKSGNNGPIWSPVAGFELIKDKARNSYSGSLSFSQILSKNAQISLFLDVVQQQGWLGNPMQRVYFKDRANYYIGNASDIPNYTSSSNTEVFQLADDIERLPDTRLKTPIGMRFNYFINEFLSLRTYYRYYTDDWGVDSHTAQLEVPIKISTKFTLYPSYRYYTQTAADYFAPFEEHLSTEQYYTSDFDLSAFDADSYGFGFSYTDVFTKFKISKYGLKNLDVRYNYYTRTTGLKSWIISAALKFVMQ